MKTPQKAVIIGAGIGGIATSIRLACLGIEVTVLEANDYPGGKLSEVQLGNYRFDAGPSLFTMPHFIEELFELAKEPIESYFRYQRMPIACQYFFEDGTQITAWGEEDRFVEELATKTGEPAAHIRKFLAHSRELYDITEHVFLKKSLHKIGTYLSMGTFRSALQLHKLNVFQSMNRANEAFFRSPKLVQFFNRFATYNGSNPYQAPATLNVIPHLENGFGTFLPEGGMHQITQSLFLLAKKLGVSFLMGHRAEEILYANGRAQGVRAQDKVFAADIVVSNMDMVGTYRKLLPQLPAPERLLRQPKSSSALIFYWGIKKQFPQLDLHNIFFSADYRGEFHEMFQHQSIGPDPTVYINITSKYTPGDAPADGENWFTMVNAPNEQGQDWDRLIEQTKTNVVNKLSRLLNTPIAPLIEEEGILSPRLIEQKTSSAQGALYGNSSNNPMAAFLRHPNFSSQLKNLYFCGGSVHPGGGIPLCLLSAKIVADLVAHDFRLNLALPNVHVVAPH